MSTIGHISKLFHNIGVKLTSTSMRQILRTDLYLQRRFKSRMTVKFLVPKDISSVKSGDVVEIHVKEGQQVKKNDSIMFIETEKVVLNETAPVDGTITKIFVKEGQQNIALSSPLYSMESA